MGAFGWEFGKAYTLPVLAPIGESGRSDTAYYFEATKSGSPKAFARTAIPVRESGFGAMLLDTSDATGNTFWLLNDRGLATSYQTATLEAKIFPFPNYHQKLVKVRVEGSSLQVVSVDSIRSWESPTVYTVGLPSSKVSPDEVALKARMDVALVDETAVVSPVPNGYDFEALRRLPSGNFLASDEFGPFLTEIDATTKRIEREWYPGAGLPKVFGKRRNNRGFEAMAVTPSGKVVAALQSAACNPDCDTKSSRAIRVLWFDPATTTSKEYVYLADLKGAYRRDGAEVKLGDMVALSETRFLTVEHGKDAFDKYWIDIVEFDLSAATDIHDGSDKGKGRTFSGGLTPEELGMDTSTTIWATAGIAPVAKTVRRTDLLSGGTVWTSQKPEGLALLGDSALVLLNDNDYGANDKDADGIPHLLSDAERLVNIVYLRQSSWTDIRSRHPRGESAIHVRRVGGALRVTTDLVGPAAVGLLDPSGRRLAGAISIAGVASLDLTGVPEGLHLVEIRAAGMRRAVPVLVAP